MDLKTKIVLNLKGNYTESIKAASEATKGLGKSLRTVKASGLGKQLVKDVKGLQAPLGKLKDNFAGLASLATKISFGVGAAAVGGMTWFAKSSLDAASAMETLGTALETTEGGAEGAQRALTWITDFTAKTPYQLDQVGEAFSRLRAYGIDPTGETLRTLGDTSSAMAKPLMQSVEAFADALVGENERLKEFGIKASVDGDKIAYAYTDASGRQRLQTVNKTNRAMIQSTLLAIWNEKYAGSMKRQSKTWAGLVSNLSDLWTQFQVKVMESGPFDHLKTRLQGVLDKVNEWASDGTLERWADQIGKMMIWAFERAEEGMNWVIDHWPEIERGARDAWTAVSEFGRGVWDAITKTKDLVGGWENLAKVIAGIKVASMLSPLLSVGKQLTTILGTATKLAKVAGVTLPSISAAGALTTVGVTGAVVGGTLATKAAIDAVDAHNGQLATEQRLGAVRVSERLRQAQEEDAIQQQTLPLWQQRRPEDVGGPGAGLLTTDLLGAPVKRVAIAPVATPATTEQATAKTVEKLTDEVRRQTETIKQGNAQSAQDAKKRDKYLERIAEIKSERMSYVGTRGSL